MVQSCEPVPGKEWPNADHQMSPTRCLVFGQWLGGPLGSKRFGSATLVLYAKLNAEGHAWVTYGNREAEAAPKNDRGSL
eukprot:Skav207976  [mRNA]  locus=scaffold3328:6606:16254:- [translate_table: standard]